MKKVGPALGDVPRGGDPADAAPDALCAFGPWLLFAAAAFRGACTMLQNYLGESVGHRLAYELRLAFYAKLQRLSFRYHDRTHTGELMTRGILDIEQRQGVEVIVADGAAGTVLRRLPVQGARR